MPLHKSRILNEFGRPDGRKALISVSEPVQQLRRRRHDEKCRAARAARKAEAVAVLMRLGGKQRTPEEEAEWKSALLVDITRSTAYFEKRLFEKKKAAA